jgi:hypothetical protein
MMIETRTEHEIEWAAFLRMNNAQIALVHSGDSGLTEH